MVDNFAYNLGRFTQSTDFFRFLPSCSELGRYLYFQNFNLSVLTYALVLYIVRWFDIFRQVIPVYDMHLKHQVNSEFDIVNK